MKGAVPTLATLPNEPKPLSYLASIIEPDILGIVPDCGSELLATAHSQLEDIVPFFSWG
jgi:hypothetical protein